MIYDVELSAWSQPLKITRERTIRRSENGRKLVEVRRIYYTGTFVLRHFRRVIGNPQSTYIHEKERDQI